MNEDQSYKLYLEGRGLYDQGEYAQAIEHFKMSNKESAHFKSLELWGECELKLGNPHKAVMPLTAATELNKGIRAPSLLAQAYNSIGEAAKAIDLARSVLAQAPGNKVARGILGEHSEQI